MMCGASHVFAVANVLWGKGVIRKAIFSLMNRINLCFNVIMYTVVLQLATCI